MRIGVFDSGVGGLTVLREIRRHNPNLSTVYLGDTARVPYGTKSPQTVQKYALANARFLLEQKIDGLVVACNTASAWALDSLKSLPVPVIGVIEPGAELAAATTNTGKIGVLGTAGTVQSRAYEAALRRLRSDLVVESIACPLFVPLAEEGWIDNPIARAVAEKYLAPWSGSPDRMPDVVILGCTHYPLLKPLLSLLLGDDVKLVDSAEAIARHIQREMRTSVTGRPEHRLFLTDASQGFVNLARNFLGEEFNAAGQIEVVDLIPLD